MGVVLARPLFIPEISTMKRFIYFCLSILMLWPLMANADFPVIDLTAIAQLISEVGQLEQETQMMQQELQTLQSGQYQWSNAQALINQLGGVVQQTNSIAYSAQNVNQQFQQNFPGYQAPANYNQQYQQITNNTLSTLNGVLQTVGTSAQDFQNENSRLAFLQAQSQNAQGQMQVMQAATQIASEQVTQLQLLRQTLISQTNAQTVYYASQMQDQASAQAEFNQVLSNGNTAISPLNSNPLSSPF